jgi:hypothetical protein
MKKFERVRFVNADKNNDIPYGAELDVLSFTDYGANVVFENVIIPLNDVDFELIEEPKQQKQFEYTPKKDIDFILISCKEVCINIKPLGYDVVFKNEINGIETLKSFRTPKIEYIKTVMSIEEIDAVQKANV